MGDEPEAAARQGEDRWYHRDPAEYDHALPGDSAFEDDAEHGGARDVPPPEGTLPGVGEIRWLRMLGLAAVAITATGIRTNAAKTATQVEVTHHGVTEYFDKPIFLGATYQLGMLVLLPFAGWAPSDLPTPVYRQICVSAILMACSAVCEYSAYSFLPVSVAVMLRIGIAVVITAIGSAYVTKRSPMNWRIAGCLLLVIAGLIFAGISHMAVGAALEDGMNLSQLVGLGLILASALFAGLEQTVVEVVLQTEEDCNVSPLLCTGLMGLFGTGFMIILFIIAQIVPGSDHGVEEDTLDTLGIVSSNWLLAVLVFILVVSCLFQLLSGHYIVKELGVTLRSALAGLRMVSTWVFAVLLFYLSEGSFGEEWQWGPAIFQMGGGLTIVLGILGYVYTRRLAEQEARAAKGGEGKHM